MGIKLGTNKVKAVQKKIKTVKGQIEAAIKSANLIFQQALTRVNKAIESIKTKRKELHGLKSTLSLEVEKINAIIAAKRKEIIAIEANYKVIDGNMLELENAVKLLEEQRDKIKEFIVKV